MSSAYMVNFAEERRGILDRPLMYRIKSRGPRIEP